MMTLRGIVPPLLTPRDENGRPQVDALQELTEHLIAGGVHGLFVLGTTGEGPVLSPADRSLVIRTVCRTAADRLPVVVGTMDGSPDATTDLARQAADAGAAAVVVTPPLFLPLSARENVAYLTGVAERSPLPVLLYNLPPGLAGSPIPPVLLPQLMECARILGIKDSSGGMEYLHYAVRLARTHRPDWSIFIGPEGFLAEAVLFGASGGVSGGANLFPGLYVALYDAASRGDLPATRRLHDLVLDFGDVVFGPPGTTDAIEVIRALRIADALRRGETVEADRFPFFDPNRLRTIRDALPELAERIADALQTPEATGPSTARS
ncbi:MAG: dihydrodipicolinate synthase family protein [Capsulimonadales bacterium]|nr:dihydrodipicolinate synthase family protein [Capsulimonadales bacterium]